MKNKFIMTAISTLLAFQVAVADDMMKSSDDKMMMEKQQHKLAKVKHEANHNKMKKGTKVAIDAVMDFQFATAKNEARFKHAAGESYVNRLYTAAGATTALVTDPANGTPAAAARVVLDHDGGILGDYSKDKHYDVNALINFKLEQMIMDNMSIGGVLEVKTPVSSQRLRDYSVGAKSKGAYMFLKSPYFVAQAGAMVGAEQVLKIDSAMWSAADGGVSSGWINYANLEGDYVDAVFDATAANSTRNRDVLRPFYVTPTLYSQYVSTDSTFSRNDDASIAPKLSVYSNHYNGFQVGASYVPHQSITTVTGVVPTAKERPVYDDVFALGANYEQSFGDIMMKVAIAGETGKAIKDAAGDTTYHDLQDVSVGGMLNYSKMFTVGAEYGYLGKSGLSKQLIQDTDLNAVVPAAADVTPNNTYYWTIGGAYDMGPARISVGYFESVMNPYSTSKSDESTMTDFNVGAHYNFSYGSKRSQFTPYIAYNHFTTKEQGNVVTIPAANTVTNNKGNVFMLGVKAIF